MKPSDFIHPEDAAALRQMENIPGFAALVKKVLAIGIENLQYNAIHFFERIVNVILSQRNEFLIDGNVDIKRR